MNYFTIEELTKSDTATRRGIDNTPTEEVKKNLTTLVDQVLDPLRAAWGAPIVVNSGYRCPALNEAVGGSKTSDHMTGRAADIEAADRTAASNARLFALVQSPRSIFRPAHR